ncbi:MAG TPA: radical SAM protein [Verrucomicrobiae bacterium]
MSVAVAERIAGLARDRQGLARARIPRARAALAECRLCAHHCGVNRLAGETGLCRAGAETRCFSAQVEVADELELIPTFAVALSGCDLRCDFCVTGAESWNARAGQSFCAPAIAERARRALENGAATVMILGGEPTIHLPAVLELVSLLPASAKLVWKTNAHGSAQARELLAGLFDVWLADFKFGNDACAQRLAKIANYGPVVRENLRWFAGEVSLENSRIEPLNGGEVLYGVPASAGSANQGSMTVGCRVRGKGELIVRHLLMPGHVDCCWQPVAEWLAETLPGIKVSLRRGFWPAWHWWRHSELAKPLSDPEMEKAVAVAKNYSLNLIA